MDADLLLDRLLLISNPFERDIARAFAGTELSRERGGGGPRDVPHVGDGGGGPGMTTLSATAPSWAARAWSFVRRAVVIELRIYESIGRAIVRRPKLPPGATGFRYHQPVQAVLVILIVISAIEIPILDLIVHRWPPVRIALLVLSIWGLTWMIGLLCAYLTRPHAVGTEGIRVRDGLELDVPLGWDDIASVSRVRHVDQEKSPRIRDTMGDRIL